MLRSNNQYQTPNEYYNIHQMAVAGDVLEDFIVIFRDMMNRVCKLKQRNKIYNLILEQIKHISSVVGILNKLFKKFLKCNYYIIKKEKGKILS